MQRTIKYFLLSLFTTVILVSCGNGESLQRYYVDHQEAKNFISQDLPLSMIEIDKSQFTEAQKEAYESVNKLNFLGYKVNDNNVEEYNAELAKVKTILSNSKYNDLMQFSDRGNKISVKYIGTDDEADEVILFGSSKETGFGVVRVLGNDMSPDKMVTLIEVLQKANIQSDQIENVMNFFK
ncbi:DUF4252 domain-containing protein [Tamlana sp. 2201CG12-4]|uniref:DUF4252 domain-containing protein n=1 Tax=Tamlana sp. 2201CG12-4 TaxID=3112582 RepID=UPI002DBE75D4|nr:DUF4252 domain-containing protein [Tamlana sp. 2201CG12-4]MEC3908390.1 DUF4252 domain-containing protein [Tamlana sp. 2201CG12-4]